MLRQKEYCNSCKEKMLRKIKTKTICRYKIKVKTRKKEKC